MTFSEQVLVRFFFCLLWIATFFSLEYVRLLKKIQMKLKHMKVSGRFCIWRFLEGLLKDLSSNSSLPFLNNNNQTLIRAATLHILEIFWTTESLQNLLFRICMTWAFTSQTTRTGGNVITGSLDCWICSLSSHRRTRLLQPREGQWHQSMDTLLLPLITSTTERRAFPPSLDGSCSTFQAFMEKTFIIKKYFTLNSSLYNLIKTTLNLLLV